MAQQVALQPFASGTRQRIRKIGVIPFVAGQPAQSLELPRVGCVNRIHVQFRGTVTKGGSAALADSSPWGLLSRVRLNANVGAASIVDVSGYGLYAIQPTLKGGYSAANINAPNATGAASDFYTAPTANGGPSPLEFSLIIPVAVNNGAQFDSGVIQLQSPSLRTTLDIVWGQLTDYAADATAITGALHVSYEFYEVPDLSRYALPRFMLCRTLEETVNVTNTGDVAYTVPHQGVVLNATHIVRINGQRSDAVDEFIVRLNKSDEPYRIERQFMRARMRYQNTAQQETGVFSHNWYDSYEQMNTGSLRDCLDSDETSVTELVTVVSSTAALGVGNNSVSTVRRILQTMEG